MLLPKDIEQEFDMVQTTFTAQFILSWSIFINPFLMQK